MGFLGTLVTVVAILFALARFGSSPPAPVSVTAPSVPHASWADASRRLLDYGAALRTMHATLRDRTRPPRASGSTFAVEFR